MKTISSHLIPGSYIMKVAVILTLLLHTNNFSTAQSGLVSAGSDYSGAGGTVSFSAGLVDYITISAAAGSMAEGLQHPIELFTAAVVEPGPAGIQITAGPNPAVYELTLFVETPELSGFRYSVYTPAGQIILNRRVTESESVIPVGFWPAGVYVLEVKQHGIAQRSFKIIKL